MAKVSKNESAYPWHGFLGSKSWDSPVMTQYCDQEARPGYCTKKAHEYEDHEHVLHEKVSLLADLIKRSSNCLVYSGAGISTASGISDYATKSDTKFAVKKTSGFSALPTYAHKALVKIQQAGLIKYWVQQNHDGLPQKAGLPQQYLNEIHGAWYDPTNPVVPMSGDLRGDLFDDLIAWEERTDLTLSLGTSMCGMNSDRVFTTVSEKSIFELRQKKKKGKTYNEQDDDNEGKSTPVHLGGVIIGIQKTQHDDIACLHIFSRIDRVMELLLQALNIPPPPSSFVFYKPNISKDHVVDSEIYRIRYDLNGLLCEDDNDGSLLDLRFGSRIKMVSGPYQGDRGKVIGILPEGHYKLEFVHTLDYRKRQTVAPYRMIHILGSWFIEAAVNGTLKEIPIVNC